MRTAIVIVIMILMCGTGVFAEESPPSTTLFKSGQAMQDVSKPNKDAANNERHIKLDYPITVKVLPSPDAEANAAKQEKNEEKKATNERLMVGSTVILALVTTILAVFTGYLWHATRQLVRGSERTAEQQLRAYVYTKHDDPLTEDSEGCVAAPVVIKNFGQTPAAELVSDLDIGFYRYPLDVKLEPAPRLTKPSKSALAPGEQIQQFAVLPVPLNQAEKDAIAAENGAIFVHGTLSYTDAFNKSRVTRVCLYSTGDAFSNGMLAYYHEGNDAT